MKRYPALPFVACCVLAVGITLGACGGGSSGKPTDSSKVPTATLPATLPEVKVLSGAVVQPGGALTYTIKDGDTLAGIASDLGVSLDDLRAANPGVDPGTLRVGQTIRLPDNTEPVAPAPTAPPTPPTAAPAATEAVPPTEPPPTDTPVVPPTTAPDVPTPTPSSLGQTYIVEEGDFPAKIAEKFGITVEALLAANPGINPTDMHIGDVIIIPAKPAP